MPPTLPKKPAKAGVSHLPTNGSCRLAGWEVGGRQENRAPWPLKGHDHVPHGFPCSVHSTGRPLYSHLPGFSGLFHCPTRSCWQPTTWPPPPQFCPPCTPLPSRPATRSPKQGFCKPSKDRCAPQSVSVRFSNRSFHHGHPSKPGITTPSYSGGQRGRPRSRSGPGLWPRALCPALAPTLTPLPLAVLTLQVTGPGALDELSPAPSPFLVALGAQEPTGFLPPLPAALPDLQNTPSFTPPTGGDCPEALELTALL